MTGVVDANYRFMAAYQEVNARVTQRQQALALYISLVVSLLAVLVALRPAGGGKELTLTEQCLAANGKAKI